MTEYPDWLPDELHKANLTIVEVARFFEVHVKTIRRWMGEDSDFPKPFKKFQILRFPTAGIIKYYKKNKKGDFLGTTGDNGGQRAQCHLMI